LAHLLLNFWKFILGYSAPWNPQNVGSIHGKLPHTAACHATPHSKRGEVMESGDEDVGKESKLRS